METIQAEVTTITPTRARRLIDGQKNIRTPSMKLVKRYAADMASGRWDINGEAIKLDADGNLIDGQHRLLACIESGKEFRTLIVEGVESDYNIDRGRGRNHADYLRREHGVPNATQIAPAIATLITAARSTWAEVNTHTTANQTTYVSTQEIVDFARQFDDEVRFAAIMPKRRGMKGTGWLIRVRLVGALSYRDKIEEFCDGVLTGEALTKNDARLTLRNSMIQSRTPSVDRSATDWYSYRTVVAWNAYAQDRALARLTWRADSVIPDPIGLQDWRVMLDQGGAS